MLEDGSRVATISQSVRLSLSYEKHRDTLESDLYGDNQPAMPHRGTFGLTLQWQVFLKRLNAQMPAVRCLARWRYSRKNRHRVKVWSCTVDRFSTARAMRMYAEEVAFN